MLQYKLPNEIKLSIMFMVILLEAFSMPTMPVLYNIMKDTNEV